MKKAMLTLFGNEALDDIVLLIIQPTFEKIFKLF
jgi:hypothetical protein